MGRPQLPRCCRSTCLGRRQALAQLMGCTACGCCRCLHVINSISRIQQFEKALQLQEFLYALVQTKLHSTDQGQQSADLHPFTGLGSA